MSGRTTLALVVVAAGLLAWVWFYEIGGEERRAEQERAEKRLLELEPDAVTALRLPLRDGAGSAYLVREDGGWRLREPLEYPADAATVKTVLDTLANVESKASFEDLPDDLSAFGLADGAERVEVFAGEGDPVVLRLGGDTPLPGSVYVQLASEPERVHTIDTYRNEALHQELTRLRDSRISRIDADRVGGVRVSEGGRLVAAAEKVETVSEEGADPLPEWRVFEPVEDRGDAVRIRRLVQDLTLARASEFVDAPGPLAEYGLAEPEVVVELSAEGTTERLALGRKGDAVYARRDGEGPVFRIHERTLDQVPRDVFAFRDKQVFTLEPTDVRQLELHFAAEGASRSLVRDDEGWRVVGEEAETPPQERIEDLALALEYVEATGTEDADADRGLLGLQPPAVRVVALDAKGAELGWLELGTPEPGLGTPALSSQNERVWRVRNDLADVIPLGLEAWQNRWAADEGDDEDDGGEDAEAGSGPGDGGVEDLE